MSIIFDVETIGLPPRKPKEKGDHFYGASEYPDCSDLSSYDSCRVVQISWITVTPRRIRKNRVNDFIIKPKDFQVGATHIHGISHTEAVKKGVDMKTVLKFFMSDLKKAKNIIAHNLQFDYHVLKSEMYRLGLYSMIEEFDSKTQICTMRLCTCEEKYEKPPRLSELYETLLKKPMENLHDSKYDTINLYKVCVALQKRKMLSLT